MNERQLIASLVLSGLSGTGIVVILNTAAKTSSTGQIRIDLVVVFLALVFSFRITQTALMSSVSEAVETSLNATRLRIVEKFSRISLTEFESLRDDRPTREVATLCSNISNAVVPFVGSIQSAVLLVLMFGYLLYISPLAAIITMLLSAQVAYGFISRLNVLNAAMAYSAQQHADLSGALDELSSGFKELRLDAKKRKELTADLATFSASAAAANVSSTALNTNLMILASSAAYLLGAVAVFLLPTFGSPDNATVRAVLTVILFMMGPLSGCANSIQQIAIIRFATEQIDAFEERLDALTQELDRRAVPSFERIDIDGITYEHANPDRTERFPVGPLYISLIPGTITFLTGGNGSGKTTALRMITGLYPKYAGKILLNGRPLDANELESYRQFFGTVFADAHVFRRPYGMSDAQLKVFDDYLSFLKIRHKLPQNLTEGYDPNRLSTGERKRLALAIAVAEGRPILVFDELAADQDPQFREVFYRQILQQLRSQGRSIFAITHDERFFDSADVRYQMEEGKMSLVVP